MSKICHPEIKALYLFIKALFKNSALQCQVVKSCICAEFLHGHVVDNFLSQLIFVF